MDRMSATTKKDLKFFKSECAFWVDFLNLKNWRVEIEIGDTDNDYANVLIYYEAKILHVTLSDSNFPKENRNEKLSEIALHELFEGGVLGLLKIIAKDRNFSESQLEAEIHAVVHLCSKIMLPLRNKK